MLLLERLRMVLYGFCGWWFVRVVVRLMCDRFWSGFVPEGAYWITCSPRVVGWGCDIAGAWFLAATSFGSKGAAVLSSGAFCLVAFFIP